VGVDETTSGGKTVWIKRIGNSIKQLDGDDRFVKPHSQLQRAWQVVVLLNPIDDSLAIRCRLCNRNCPFCCNNTLSNRLFGALRCIQRGD
jgi:hypothetical protein